MSMQKPSKFMEGKEKHGNGAAAEKKKKKRENCQIHTNFPVENDDNIMLESSLPLIIMVLSIADVTQLTGATCSLQ